MHRILLCCILSCAVQYAASVALGLGGLGLAGGAAGGLGTLASGLSTGIGGFGAGLGGGNVGGFDLKAALEGFNKAGTNVLSSAFGMANSGGGLAAALLRAKEAKLRQAATTLGDTINGLGQTLTGTLSKTAEFPLSTLAGFNGGLAAAVNSAGGLFQGGQRKFLANALQKQAAALAASKGALTTGLGTATGQALPLLQGATGALTGGSGGGLGVNGGGNGGLGANGAVQNQASGGSAASSSAAADAPPPPYDDPPPPYTPPEIAPVQAALDLTAALIKS